MTAASNVTAVRTIVGVGGGPGAMNPRGKIRALNPRE